MPATNVKSKWVDGDLYFYDLAGDEIFHIDGTNRAFVLPVGSTLTNNGSSYVVTDPDGVTIEVNGSDELAIIAASLDGTQAAEVADVNVIGGLPVLFRIAAAALTGDTDVTMTHKVRVIDAWCVATAAGGAADTITIKNGATAITDAMDLNVSDKVVVRAGTIDDASHEIAAAGTLRVSGASAATCVVYVLAIRVA